MGKGQRYNPGWPSAQADSPAARAKRQATKPTRASQERRIEAKKTRATVKSVRSKKIRHDE